MSEKGTPPQSSGDEHTMETSDSVFHQQHTAQPGELTSSSDTTLQDLPIEILECILVQVVALEVKAMKLAKSVWKEKADLVINRLKVVCSQWNIILSNDCFRNKVHRYLEGTALETIRVEVLLQSPRQSSVWKVIAMKDEIFMLCMQNHGYDYVIKVYDCTNMVDVKDVIALPGIHVPCHNGLAACNVSNSLYAIHEEWQEGEWVCLAVWRIARDEEHQFQVSPWISDLRLPISGVFASGNGSVMILSEADQEGNVRVGIYDANASLQHEISLSDEFFCLMGDDKVIQRSNGNLVLASLTFDLELELTEIDLNGSILRRYKSSVIGDRPSCATFADIHGRILISDRDDRMELLDSEFNLLEFSGPQLVEGMFSISYETYYNSARNEIVGRSQRDSFTIFRFIEE